LKRRYKCQVKMEKVQENEVLENVVEVWENAKRIKVTQISEK